MKLKMKCNSTFEEIEKIGTEIRNIYRKKINDQKAFELELIFNEICSNIIRHGYRCYKCGVIEVQLDNLKDDTVEIIIMDSSPKFDPINYKEKLGEFENLEKGGMGLYIIKKIARDLEYKYENNKNIYKIIV
jgi:serine/threonine-protein kinase RsbW